MLGVTLMETTTAARTTSTIIISTRVGEYNMIAVAGDVINRSAQYLHPGNEYSHEWIDFRRPVGQLAG